MDAFKWMLNASKLMISQSTFGWWAAILSEAEVWMPETPASIWSRRSGINLRVYDNPRWTIFPADVSRQGMEASKHGSYITLNSTNWTCPNTVRHGDRSRRHVADRRFSRMAEIAVIGCSAKIEGV